MLRIHSLAAPCVPGLALITLAMGGCDMESDYDLARTSELYVLRGCMPDANIATAVGDAGGAEADAGSSPSESDGGAGPGATSVYPRIRSVRSSARQCRSSIIADDEGHAAIALFEYITDESDDHPVGLGFCHVIADLDVPAGYRYSVESFDVEADVSVADTAEFRLHAAYSFLDSSSQSEVLHDVVGPRAGTIVFTSIFENGISRRCGSTRPLDLRLDVAASHVAPGPGARVEVRKVSKIRVRLQPCD